MILLALALLPQLGATNYQVDSDLAVPTRKPDFADEFAGASVDTRNWRFDTSRNAAGWFNHEAQYYALRNATVASGMLTIEARVERASAAPDYGNQAYTSAKLVSRRAFAYGFYEVKARLPCARGTWPAIWLLPSSGSWPAAGEIDVMEMVGWDANNVHATLHSEAFNHVRGTQRGAERRIPTACTEFHRYQLDWRPGEILIGVDDHAYLRVANDQSGGAAAWPFTRPYQLILNLAIGGDWGGKQGIDDAALPQRMTVDYVRYWRR